MWRLRLIAFVTGCASVHLCARLPGAPWAAFIVAAASALGVWLWLVRARSSHRLHVFGLAWTCVFLCLGFGTTAWRADARLADALPLAMQERPIAATFIVTGLASTDARSQRFEARLLDAPSGVPRRVMLAWYAPVGGIAPPAVPGQVWRGSLSLKRPHGLQNPHGFDFEAMMFERNLRATGTVRGLPRLVDDRPWVDAGALVQRARHHLRAGMLPALDGKRYGAVITALAMGDQASVAKEDWKTFSRTGITHLVSISGLHVTMMAAVGGALALLLWSRVSWRGLMLAERCPAQVVGAAAALSVAGAYCLVAGWGIPARRTFFMLAVIAGAAMLRLPLAGSRVLVLAAFVVTALDPWAPLASGFWLSFGAVALLMLGGSGNGRLPVDDLTRSRWRQTCAGAGLRLRDAAAVQLALTLGLLPLLAVLFHQVSVVSPLCNAFAIPVVSFIVTPLALFAMVACQIPWLESVGRGAAGWAHAAFEAMMVPVESLASWPAAAFDVAAPPWMLVGVGVLGAIWALQPAGLPRRAVAAALLAPILCYAPERPLAGDWRLVALDVGQGGGVVIETASQVLLFDTGPPYGEHSDAGERVIAPYLRARGLRRVDTLIVSHGDVDHAGGLASVLDALPVTTLMASYDVADELMRVSTNDASLTRPAFRRCLAGQTWEVDGVVFQVLHPGAPVDTRASSKAGDSKARNEASCVLRVQGRHHAALLTGDIGHAQEQTLAGRGGVRADVVMAAHHGSRGSSHLSFVRATHAAHVIAQAGNLNRYKHPHPQVVARWTDAGAVMHRSDRDGAVTASSEAGQLTVVRHRESHRRYWHGA